MLMPLFTVRTATAAVPVTAVAEAARLHERMPAGPVRISGSQSEAVLKILETLNRHFVGSEPMPKEALIRLLDTLAKLLKFPPLPQESLRDFSKRLAVFLETLTPAARTALEKQLAQRNLGLSVRLLAEALKHPAAIDASRFPDRPSTPAPFPGRTDGRSAPPAASAQGQAAMPNRLATLPMQQAIPGGAPMPADAGRLQAALRQAFGNDDEAPISTGAQEESESAAARPARRSDQTADAPTARRGADTAAAQIGLAGRASLETIPLLRAAAAFLAADPQALALVAAIAGEMDGQLKAELEQELGLDRPAEPEQTNSPEAEMPDEKPHRQALRNEEGQKATLSANQAASRDMAPRATAGAMASVADPAADNATTPARPQPSRPIAENTEFRNQGLDTEPDGSTAAGQLQSEPDEAPTNRPEKTLVQALKTLIESALPLPGGTNDGAPDAPFSLFSGDTADMQADALFAQLDSAEDTAPQPRPASYVGGRAELVGLEADGWAAMGAPEEEPSGRPAFTRPQTGEDAAQDARAARPETGLARDAIPFAMIPYLPARAEDMRKAEVDTEDRPDLAGDEEKGEDGSLFQDDGDEPDGEEQAAGEANENATENGGDVDTGYGFYRRMGEIG